MRRLVSHLLVAFTVLSLSSGLWGNEDIKSRLVDNVIEVTGGGSKPWKLRYANVGKSSTPLEIEETHITPAGRDRAYFSHGPWLRWIDTKHGIVVGRWLLPGRITKISPNGDAVNIDIADKYAAGKVLNRTFKFTPDHPEIPSGAIQNLLAYRIAETEALSLFTASAFQSVGADQARALLPEIQEAIRRDPLSPWFRVLLGKIMLDAGDPGSSAVFEQAIDLPIDYTELFPISAYLENSHFPQAADKAFQRGYGDLLKRGHDPRMAGSLIIRLVFYPIDWKKIELSRHRAVVERLYQLTPDAEGAELAWTSFSRSAKTPEEQKLWLGRTMEARKNGLDAFGDLILQFDVVFLVCVACGLGKFCFTLVSYVRYRPQRRFDKDVAKQTHVSLWKRIPFLNIQYWSLPQRVGFALIFLIAWFCAGWAKQSLTGAMLFGESPISFGSLADPIVQSFFQNRLSRTPERDFLLALSDQQGGDNESAARLYRQAPQYAESWNNLGVIRRSQGREADAVDGFQRALQIDPALPEAKLNLGRPTSDYWARIHQQYAPNTPMMACPPKRLVMNAFVGGSLSQRFRSAWKDALQPWHFDLDSMKVINEPSRRGSVISTMLWVGFWLMIFLFLLPRLPIQKDSGRVGNILAALFPGTLRKWGSASGLVLVAWIYFVIQLVLLTWIGSPHVLTFIATPNLVRAYGPPEVPIGTLINPGWVLLYLAPATLFLLNLLVVLPGLRAKEVPEFSAIPDGQSRQTGT